MRLLIAMPGVPEGALDIKVREPTFVGSRYRCTFTRRSTVDEAARRSKSKIKLQLDITAGFSL